MARKIESNCVLGHIRSATMGDITTYNCHPFSYKEYSFVHNGGIEHFEDLRRELISELDEELFHAVKGQTDSEHLFFLIMQFLKQDKQENLENALLKAVKWVNDRQKDTDSDHFSGLNIAISNGRQLIVTRYCSKDYRPISLYYTTSRSKELLEDEVTFENLIVASEPLTNLTKDWIEITPNHYLIFDLEKGLEIKGFKFT
jgi:predicted glutamine amidotransferase